MIYIGRGAKAHVLAASFWLPPLESVSSGQGCSDGKLQGVLGQVGRLAKVDCEGCQARLCCAIAAIWTAASRHSNWQWAQQDKVAERFIGGGIGPRQRRAATQVRGWSSRERASPSRVRRKVELRDIVDGGGLWLS